MKPWQKAANWFSKFSNGDTFEQLLAEYFKNGYVWSTPLSFMLFRPVFWDGKDIYLETDNHNAWFLHLAAGDMRDMFRAAPFPLEYLVFQRHAQDTFRAYKFKTLQSKLNGIES